MTTFVLPPSGFSSSTLSSPTMPRSALPSSTLRVMSALRWKSTVTPGSDGISAVYLRKLVLRTPRPQERRNMRVGS